MAYNFIIFIFFTGIVVSVSVERSCNYRGGFKNDSFTEHACMQGID